MCGLFGWFSSSIASTDIDKFNLLMFLSTTRGRDSTGVLSVIRHGHWGKEKDVRYHFLKSPVPAWDFQRFTDYHTLTRGQDVKGLMGHARAATIGAVNSDNAHPFESPNGQIVGAHNGTLTGEYPFKQKDRTDSEAIMAIIEKDGLKGLSSVNGAWALTFLDTVNNTFNIIRNRERPLFYIKTGAGDFGYASEKWMLQALKDKFNLSGDIIDLEPYKLLSIDMMEERFLADGISISDVEGLEAPKYTQYNGGRFRGYHGAYGDWDSETDELPLVWQNPRNYLANPETTPTGPHSRIAQASNGVSVAAVGGVGGGKLIEEAQKKREEEAKVSPEKKEATVGVKTSNVVGFSRDPKTGKFETVKSKGSTKPSEATGKSLVASTPRLPGGNLPFLRNLPEQQRMTGTGAVEVETLKGNWVSMEDFLLMLEYGSCKWTNESSDVTDKRYWLNKSEWISEAAWEDPEIKHMYGNDPSVLNSFLQ